ncbi:activating transcription factor 3 [Octopus vulgaris]|uniref:Activating transcription factor 3 n=1 Tax=Octopus vulgaris TaxID=6645 RepID=A0AA36BA63_OCTVU|nr:activating transcription factor 3 [Octopus vulgaris]
MKGDVCPENDSYDNVSDNEKDSQLKEAVEKVNETGDMIHIIKQELKCQILYKRFQEGKNAVDTEVKPPIQYELRPEEETRILRRREQNRKAAQRCRLRKKNKMEELEDTDTDLHNCFTDNPTLISSSSSSSPPPPPPPPPHYHNQHKLSLSSPLAQSRLARFFWIQIILTYSNNWGLFLIRDNY